MTAHRFANFLKVLGYSRELIDTGLKENVFTYRIDVNDPEIADFPPQCLDLHYVYTTTEKSIFETHSDFWNQNSVNAFVAVSEDKCHVINAREKPDETNPLSKTIAIKSFNYGINSEGFDREKLEEISKDAVDSTHFFDFVIQNQKTGHEVDKDLLLNLIALRNDLEQEGNDKIVYLLILKCLFIKYLEDRGIYPQNYLLDILRSGIPEVLLNAFKEIRKINGDLFKPGKIDESAINPGYMKKLSRFFSCDYRSKQLKLFPYRFDKIPVQLISNVYEAFLKSEEKRGKGIYYTPSFIVDFILSHTLREKLKQNPRAAVLDPACGSGAFLVESFKMIIGTLPQKPGFKEMQEIMETQLWGIDRDENSLQIAAFSLYLVLLENESPQYIRDQIQRAHPILPSLIGKTLLNGNALVDDNLFDGKVFDCVIANPPWGSVPEDDDPGNIKERKAIGSRDRKGANPIYTNVSDYERSQAFLLKAEKWGDNETIFAMVVKNSIFLNENAAAFRKELLGKYSLSYFYELSNLDKILFKKRAIGKVDDQEIEIGSIEPCAIVVFGKYQDKTNTISYIVPKLTGFSEKFQLIHFSQKDVNHVMQTDFLEDDLTWRVLAKGSMDDYKLIKKISQRNSKLKITCSRGFEPQKNILATNAEARDRLLIKSPDFDRYYVKKRLNTFNWNQDRRRDGDENLFNGDRILIARRPTPRDRLKLRCIFTKEEMVFRDDILGFKSEEINIYQPYLAILNSSFAGYYFFKISAQWYGGIKREALRNYDLKSFPFPDNDTRFPELIEMVNQVMAVKNNGKDSSELEKKIDELVFDLYGLLEFEKEIIREFYQINVERKKDHIKEKDIQNYVDRFRQNFKLVLDPGYDLNASYSQSNHIGAAVCFQMVKKEDFIPAIAREDIPILHIVKKSQLQQSFTSRMMNEDKVKIYDENKFYIIKSNYFKDWTARQAIKDANEEIGLLFKYLPEHH
ncbi:MAG TPA: N-6 DNA methylase, partial [Candidatus Kapabacteria bacterium]|nr:N-6 DNA methylase [Candidatus Kapabacteria bacterium]